MSDFSKEEERRKIGDRRHEKLSFNKSISLGNVLTIISLILALIGSWITVENRLTAVEGNYKSVEKMQAVMNNKIKAVEENSYRNRIEINDHLIRLEGKIDRLIDKFVYTSHREEQKR